MKKLLLSALALAVVAESVTAQTVADLPQEISKNYQQTMDMSISDEFNTPDVDWTKWARRNTGGAYVENYVKDKSLVVMESEKEGDKTTNFLSVKGLSSDGKIRTGGVVSLGTGYFGFYVLRFRFRGLMDENGKPKMTIWHPSVWGGVMDNVAEQDLKCTRSGYWLELDFMEWNPSGGWGSHTNARFHDMTGKSRIINKGEKAAMLDAEKKGFDKWVTIGMEYTDEFIKLWNWDDKSQKWSEGGDRVVKFVDIDKSNPEASYTLGTIGRESKQPVFWLVGNVVSRFLYKRIEDGTIKHSMDDMAADYDLFRYYPHNSIKDEDWSCRVEVKVKKVKKKKK